MEIRFRGVIDEGLKATVAGADFVSRQDFQRYLTEINVTNISPTQISVTHCVFNFHQQGRTRRKQQSMFSPCDVFSLFFFSGSKFHKPKILLDSRLCFQGGKNLQIQLSKTRIYIK